MRDIFWCSYQVEENCSTTSHPAVIFTFTPTHTVFEEQMLERGRWCVGRAGNEPSRSLKIMEKTHTRAFSLLKAGNTAFTFNSLLPRIDSR